MRGRCSWSCSPSRYRDMSRLRLSESAKGYVLRSRKARCHVIADCSFGPGKFSSLSRYMSKIFGVGRHDDTASCRRSAGKIGTTTLSNGRHTCRTCTRCQSRDVCRGQRVYFKRRYPREKTSIYSGSFLRSAFSWLPQGLAVGLHGSSPNRRRRFRESYDDRASVARRQRPSSTRFVLSRRQDLISFRPPFAADTRIESSWFSMCDRATRYSRKILTRRDAAGQQPRGFDPRWVRVPDRRHSSAILADLADGPSEIEVRLHNGRESWMSRWGA